MAREVSRYAELWNLIKADSLASKPVGISIAANVSLHSTIIKAIQTRKKKDSAYQFLVDESGRGAAKLLSTVEGTKIRFIITFRLTHGDL